MYSTRRWLTSLSALMVAGALLAPPCLAQSDLREPQDLGVLLYRQSDRFQPVELHRVEVRERSPLLSTSSETFLTIPGARSPLRFPSGKPIVLYLRVVLDDKDPRAQFFEVRDPTRFSLLPLESAEGSRKLSLVRTALTGTVRAVGQPLLVRLYGEQSFQLSPNGPLPPGEYAVMYASDGDERDVFSFGVDP